MTIPRMKFAIEAVRKAKQNREEEDRWMEERGTSNIFDGGERWCGDLGEDAFEYWLKDNLPPGWTYKRKRGKQKSDFIIYGPLGEILMWIDVKTWPKEGPCLNHYHGTANKKQVDGNQLVTRYVFAYFNTITRELDLMGWMEKEEFMRKAVLDRQMGATTSWPSSACSIRYGELNPMDSLMEEV